MSVCTGEVPREGSREGLREASREASREEASPRRSTARLYGEARLEAPCSVAVGGAAPPTWACGTCCSCALRPAPCALVLSSRVVLAAASKPVARLLGRRALWLPPRSTDPFAAPCSLLPAPCSAPETVEAPESAESSTGDSTGVLVCNGGGRAAAPRPSPRTPASGPGPWPLSGSGRVSGGRGAHRASMPGASTSEGGSARGGCVSCCTGLPTGDACIGDGNDDSGGDVAIGERGWGDVAPESGRETSMGSTAVRVASADAIGGGAKSRSSLSSLSSSSAEIGSPPPPAAASARAGGAAAGKRGGGGGRRVPERRRSAAVTIDAAGAEEALKALAAGASAGGWRAGLELVVGGGASSGGVCSAMAFIDRDSTGVAAGAATGVLPPSAGSRSLATDFLTTDAHAPLAGATVATAGPQRALGFLLAGCCGPLLGFPGRNGSCCERVGNSLSCEGSNRGEALASRRTWQARDRNRVAAGTTAKQGRGGRPTHLVHILLLAECYGGGPHSRLLEGEQHQKSKTHPLLGPQSSTARHPTVASNVQILMTRFYVRPKKP